MFQISLDGDQKTHNKLRGEGMFEKAVRAIQDIRTIVNTNVGVGSVIMSKNWDVLDKALEAAAENKVDHYALMFLIKSGRADAALVRW